jgi:hypothetical protein
MDADRLWPGSSLFSFYLVRDSLVGLSDLHANP